MKDFVRIKVRHSSQIGEARRISTVICRELNFTENDIGRVSLIITEMGTNLIKHSLGGELILRSLKQADINGIEILSLDNGPGMEDINRSMRDGFSTSGSSGTGLGAIRRMSYSFDIYSRSDKGTVVMSRYWAGDFKKYENDIPLECGAISIPVDEEDDCGDNWAVEQTNQRSLAFVADGLGHGSYAAEAAAEAVRLFQVNSKRRPSEILETLHTGLRSTRGVVAALAEINHKDRIVRYAGIGNIIGRIVTDTGIINLVSHNGTLGHKVQKVAEFTYPWNEDYILIMNSDGLKSQLNLSDYPLLKNHHPAVIAGVLFRDYKRGSDDSTVIVLKKYKKK